MFLEYEIIDDSHIVETQIKFLDGDDKQIYFLKYNNGNFIEYINKKFVFLKKNIFYNFEKDTESLKIEILFRCNTNIFPLGVKKIWYIPKNTDRCILKHYGGSI